MKPSSHLRLLAWRFSTVWSFLLSTCCKTSDHTGVSLGTLAAAISRGRRPHILFGSKELDLSFPPVFLPPLLNATFQRYKPEQGDLTCEEDRQTIGQLTKEARALIKDVVPVVVLNYLQCR